MGPSACSFWSSHGASADNPFKTLFKKPAWLYTRANPWPRGARLAAVRTGNVSRVFALFRTETLLMAQTERLFFGIEQTSTLTAHGEFRLPILYHDGSMLGLAYRVEERGLCSFWQACRSNPSRSPARPWCFSACSTTGKLPSDLIIRCPSASWRGAGIPRHLSCVSSGTRAEFKTWRGMSQPYRSTRTTHWPRA